MSAMTTMYEAVETIGDMPMPRFGHTITLVNQQKVVMFGGATGDTGRYAMTGDTYVFNIAKRCWMKLIPQGIVPSPRAAHAAAAIESLQLVVYGGATGGTPSMQFIGGSLASDDLYLLDLRQGDDQAQWIIVPVVGTTPGRRYGHMVSFNRPYLTVFGGNTGSEPVNDAWCLNVETSPFSWSHIVCKSELPPPRVYHSGAQCLNGTAAGMMVIFGGRTSDQSALNDTWGLRRHRDGTWDWVRAPYKAGTYAPLGRYQHSVLFVGSSMFVVGGRTNQVSDVLPLDVYDTETSEWNSHPSLKRFRHACWWSDDSIYIYGGFQQESPSLPTGTIIKCSLSRFGKLKEHPALHPVVGLHGGCAEPKVLRQDSVTRTCAFGKQLSDTLSTQEEEKVFTLSSQAHVAVSSNAEDPSFANLVRRVSIDKLQEEAKKIVGKLKVPVIAATANPNEFLYSTFINNLLKPKDYSHILTAEVFPFKREHIIELARECQCVMQSQKPVVPLRTPVKIFGNLHGNFVDLMRFFDVWKAPCSDSTGDIESFAYVFLGNLVDRGTRSLETVCLLMALKAKYPDQIHLLRGNHEDRTVNLVCGFGEECRKRLGEDINDPDSVFQAVNNVFAWMPLAVTVEGKILCVHAGIGPHVKKVDDLAKIARPVDINQDGATAETGLLLDSLWSDPAATDTETGYKRNTVRQQDNVVTYGADKAQEFLNDNGLEMIIRGHEIALEGFDTFAAGKVLTVTSCTNYCGKYNNSACMLVIQKTFEIIPKLLLPPTEPTVSKIWDNSDEVLKRNPPTPPRRHGGK